MPDPNTPRVCVVMGSESDLPVVRKCLDMLKSFDVSYRICVCSAHRTPDDCAALAKGAAARGIRVFIAAAGGAAHLAGVIAAHTTLPVIAIPIASTPLQGMDSLYAMVQMPPGIPVATVAIGEYGATNAGILATQILALHDRELQTRLVAHKQEMAQKVRLQNEHVQQSLGV